MDPLYVATIWLLTAIVTVGLSLDIVMHYFHYTVTKTLLNIKPTDDDTPLPTMITVRAVADSYIEARSFTVVKTSFEDLPYKAMLMPTVTDDLANRGVSASQMLAVTFGGPLSGMHLTNMGDVDIRISTGDVLGSVVVWPL